MSEVSAESAPRAWRSQPDAALGAADALSAADMDALISYSQPAAPDDMLLADDVLLGTPGAGAAALVRRMTRFWLRADEPGALRALAEALHARGYGWRQLHPRLLAIECSAELKIRACAWPAGPGCTMLEFRRWRGCGLQFKRRYVELREALRPLHAPPPQEDALT